MKLVIVAKILQGKFRFMEFYLRQLASSPDERQKNLILILKVQW